MSFARSKLAAKTPLRCVVDIIRCFCLLNKCRHEASPLLGRARSNCDERGNRTLISLIAIKTLTQTGYSLALGLDYFTGVSLTEMEVLHSPSEVVSQKLDSLTG